MGTIHLYTFGDQLRKRLSLAGASLAQVDRFGNTIFLEGDDENSVGSTIGSILKGTAIIAGGVVDGINTFVCLEGSADDQCPP